MTVDKPLSIRILASSAALPVNSLFSRLDNNKYNQCGKKLKIVTCSESGVADLPSHGQGAPNFSGWNEKFKQKKSFH